MKPEAKPKGKARKPRKRKARVKKADIEKRPPRPSFFSKKQKGSIPTTSIDLSCLEPKPARKPVALLECKDEPPRLDTIIRKGAVNGPVDNPLMDGVLDKDPKSPVAARILAKLSANREAEKVLTWEDHDILESQLGEFDPLVVGQSEESKAKPKSLLSE